MKISRPPVGCDVGHILNRMVKTVYLLVEGWLTCETDSAKGWQGIANNSKFSKQIRRDRLLESKDCSAHVDPCLAQRGPGKTGSGEQPGEGQLHQSSGIVVGSAWFGYLELDVG